MLVPKCSQADLSTLQISQYPPSQISTVNATVLTVTTTNHDDRQVRRCLSRLKINNWNEEGGKNNPHRRGDCYGKPKRGVLQKKKSRCQCTPRDPPNDAPDYYIYKYIFFIACAQFENRRSFVQQWQISVRKSRNIKQGQRVSTMNSAKRTAKVFIEFVDSNTSGLPNAAWVTTRTWCISASCTICTRVYSNIIRYV